MKLKEELWKKNILILSFKVNLNLVNQYIGNFKLFNNLKILYILKL